MHGQHGHEPGQQKQQRTHSPQQAEESGGDRQGDNKGHQDQQQVAGGHPQQIVPAGLQLHCQRHRHPQFAQAVHGRVGRQQAREQVGKQQRREKTP